MPLTVSGTLTFPDATGPSTLRVVKQDLLGSHPLPDVSTAANGTFSFSDAPQVGGANTYTVTFPGDATRPGASQTVTVQVSRPGTTPSARMTVIPRASVHRSSTGTTYLGTTYDNQDACSSAQLGDAALPTDSCGPVDAYGELTATFPTHEEATSSANSAGDHRDAPAEDPVRTYGFPVDLGVFRGY